MVEFDTFLNNSPDEDWDPQKQHVGININSISSAVSANWNATSYSGKELDASISHNATAKRLSVPLTYKEKESSRAVDVISASPLSYIVDLKEILPEFVTIGISAATGLYVEGHAINSWEFISSLDTNKGIIIKNGTIKKEVLVAGISFFSASLVAVGSYWVMRKNKKKKLLDDRRKLSNKNSTNGVTWVNLDLERGALPRKFSYQELVTATNGFADDRRLGQGGSNQVYRGALNDVGCLVAVKRIFGEPQQSERTFINEVKVISRLIHRNLVQFIGWCHEQNAFLLVYEYMPNASLDAHLFGDRKTLPWDVRYKIALGLASALHYLHEEAEKWVLHRDIKSANVLLDTDFGTKLGDFGVAKLVDPRLRMQQTTTLVGTYGYLAPEYVMEGRANKESDMYSFGVVALEIASGRRTYRQEEYHVPLMKWVWELYLKGNIMEAADKRLNNNFNPNEMKLLLVLAESLRKGQKQD